MMTIRGVRYMSDSEAGKAILDVGKRMYSKGFVASNDGNISVKTGPDTIWATPTGVSKGFMTKDMLVKMDLEGRVLVGTLKPSSEIKMHLRVYRENPDVQAVTHAHPPVATCFAIAGRPLDAAILTEAILSLGTIPVAGYATPGTEEVPDSIAPFVNQYNGVLLANHGALTWGDSIYQAFYRLESVEYYAMILMYTGNIIGRQNHLSCEQVDRLLEIRKNMGIAGGGVPPCMADGGRIDSGFGKNSGYGCGMSDGVAGGSAGEEKLLKERTGFWGQAAWDKEKEDLIAEIVRRVAERLTR